MSDAIKKALERSMRPIPGTDTDKREQRGEYLRRDYRFGMASMKGEGQAAHPDIYGNASFGSDEWYVRQMAAYVEWSGDNDAPMHCARSNLFTPT